MYRKEIDAYFEQHREEMLRDISRLIAIKSVREDPKPDMPFGEGPCKVLKEACDIARELHFDVHNFENYVMTAELGPQPRRVGHLGPPGRGARGRRLDLRALPHARA